MKTTQWPEGIKRTKHRSSIWQVLLDENKPITAATIASKLSSTNQTIWMSTIYRTLDFFVEKGLVLRTVLANSDMALYEITPTNHRHYAVCTECHTMIPLSTCPVVSAPHELVDHGFEVRGHNLEIYGICESCSNKSIGK